MMQGQVPRLSYCQLFSFQVAHNLVAAQQAGERYKIDVSAFKDLLKKGEWNRSILEVDFTNGMVFLQDKDKIISAQPFSDFKKFVISGEEFEDNLVSMRFIGQQWQVMTQNSAEKACLLHLLQCVSRDTSAEEAIQSAPPGTLGMNKSVLRAGILVRKAKTHFKKDERYCVLVPGKLFMFKNPNLAGQHVRYVTSLMGASVRMLHGLEFELLVPGTKTITYIPDNVEEVTGWMGALERSVEIANQILAGQPYQQEQAPPGMNMGMNPGISAGPSGGGGIPGFFQTAIHNVGAYTNPQDSRSLGQRIMGGLGGGMFQQGGQPRGGNYATPFGVSSPYTGNFQANLGQGNFQNPMGGENFQNAMNGGNYQNYGQPQGNMGLQRPRAVPLGGMTGQGGFMGQSSMGPSTSYNQPQANFNAQNAYNPRAMNQGPQQGQQNPNAANGGRGLGMIRRATQTLREFNNNMDQFLATSSNPQGRWGGSPQTQTQGYGGARQAQVPAQYQGYGGPQQAQVPGYGGGAPQMQNQGYGRGATQMQNSGYGWEGPQTQNPGYGRGGPPMLNQGPGGAGRGYGRAGSEQQAQRPAPGGNPAEWKEFESPEGRTYYYNERTKQTTWTSPY